MVSLADVRVGKITHYYDKIGVAVIELEGALSDGDTIRISGHGSEFTQPVASMQVEHENIKKAKKGDAIGLKVDQPVKDGDEVFRVS